MGAGPVPVHSVAERVPALLERLRGVHRKMVDAALTGDGFERMAELAADEVGRPVAIVIPERRIAVQWPEAPNALPLEELEQFVDSRARGEAGPIPGAVELVVPITFEREFQGGVAMLLGAHPAPEGAGEFLHLAAMASATALALEQARELESEGQKEGLITLLRSGRIDSDRALERAARDGCDLSTGFSAAAVKLSSTRPHQVSAQIRELVPGSLVEITDRVLYALLPGERAVGTEIRARIGSHGIVAVSTVYSDATELTSALREAELMLDAIDGDATLARMLDAAGSNTYGLLFRVMASQPEEVESFYLDTVAPAARYDLQYGSDLIATLEAYLGADGNMNATARTIHAHRHTVAYRLERFRELTGLDPAASEDRERIGLGLKAMRLVRVPAGS